MNIDTSSHIIETDERAPLKTDVQVMLDLISPLTVGDFLEPPEKRIKDEEEKIFESVVQMYNVVRAEEES